jgi:hypothetical protein
MDLRAVIFMPAMAGAVIFGFVFVLFASHYYLTVLEGTGTGSKEVTWISEPILDNFWKFWYMLWLFGLWFGPAYLIGRAWTAGSESIWLKLAIPIAVVWLCYPISQLSSLSASTIWLPLTADVFARLAQKPAVTLGFYLVSIPVLVLFAVAFKWAFLTESQWELLFVGAPLMVLAGFLYARLIGRLAFVLAFTKSIFQERKKKKPKAEEGAKQQAQNDEEVVPTIRQPSELPPLKTVEGDLVGYDVQFEEAPVSRRRVRAEAVELDDENEPSTRPKPPPLPPSREAKKSRPTERRKQLEDDDEDEPTAYDVHPPEVETIESTPREVVKPKESEMQLLNRDDVPKKPTNAWGPELLVFLGQPGTITALAIASGFCIVVGALVRIAREYYPID